MCAQTDVRMQVVESQANLPDIEFNVIVLTTSCWPSQPSLNIAVPAPAKKFQESFESFYGTIHKGRKLDWKFAYSSCILRAKFKEARKELVVSAAQSVVLLAFNEKRILTFNELGTRTAMGMLSR
jgi:hypothetical protein